MILVDEVGIFRLSGNKGEIESLRRQIDEGDETQVIRTYPLTLSAKPVDFESILDHNVAAGLFKLYFRELPEPLLTYKLYKPLLHTLGIVNYWKQGTNSC